MLKNLFSKTCYFCGKKTKDTTTYVNEYSQEVHVCFQCVPQAERKALRRK